MADLQVINVKLVLAYYAVTRMHATLHRLLELCSRPACKHLNKTVTDYVDRRKVSC